MSTSAKAHVHQALPWLERGLEVCRVWDIPLLFYLSLFDPGLCVCPGWTGVRRPAAAGAECLDGGMGIMRGRVHVWLSEAYLRLGRLDEALAVAMRGLEVCRAHGATG